MYNTIIANSPKAVPLLCTSRLQAQTAKNRKRYVSRGTAAALRTRHPRRSLNYPRRRRALKPICNHGGSNLRRERGTQVEYRVSFANKHTDRLRVRATYEYAGISEFISIAKFASVPRYYRVESCIRGRMALSTQRKFMRTRKAGGLLKERSNRETQAFV